MRLKATEANSLHSAKKDAKVFLGHSAQGQLAFENDTRGWSIYSAKSQSYRYQGSATVLAMGLTEICLKFGRGKVFYVLKGTDVCDGPGPCTEATLKLPSLIYVDYVWDETSKAEWLDLPQRLRYDMLNARCNALSEVIPVMPINLTTEATSYPTIVMYDNIGAVWLYHSGYGYTYLAWNDEMEPQMRGWIPPKSGRRGRWIASHAQVAQFRCTRGRQIAVQLNQMYHSYRPDSVMFMKTLLEKCIAAHDEWVAAGHYTIAEDKDLGARLDVLFRARTQAAVGPTQAPVPNSTVMPAPDTYVDANADADADADIDAQTETAAIDEKAQEMRELAAVISEWNEEDQVTFAKYSETAWEDNPFTLSMFFVDHEGWAKLSRDQKLTAIALVGLKIEEERRIWEERRANDYESDEEEEEEVTYEGLELKFPTD